MLEVGIFVAAIIGVVYVAYIRPFGGFKALIDRWLYKD